MTTQRTSEAGNPVTYVILVRGTLGEGLGPPFDGMTVQFRNGNTQLIGAVASPEQLRELVRRIHVLGFQVAAVSKLG